MRPDRDARGDGLECTVASQTRSGSGYVEHRRALMPPSILAGISTNASVTWSAIGGASLAFNTDGMRCELWQPSSALLPSPPGVGRAVQVVGDTGLQETALTGCWTMPSRRYLSCVPGICIVFQTVQAGFEYVKLAFAPLKLASHILNLPEIFENGFK